MDDEALPSYHNIPGRPHGIAPTMDDEALPSYQSRSDPLWLPALHAESYSSETKNVSNATTDVRLAQSHSEEDRAFFARYYHLLHIEGREGERQQALLWKIPA